MAVNRDVKIQIVLLIAITALTLAVCYLVERHIWHIGVPGEWQWAFYPQLEGFRQSPIIVAMVGLMVLIIAACAVYGAIGKAAKPPAEAEDTSGARAGAALCAMMAAALLLQGVFPDATPLGPAEAVRVTVVPSVGGYWAESLNVAGLREYLAKYPDRIRGISVNDASWGHLSDHPPGAIIVHWAVNHAMAAWPGLAESFWPSDVVNDTLRQLTQSMLHRQVSEAEMAGVVASAWVWRFLAVLTIIPVYLLTRAVYSRRAGLAAAAFCALIPALNMFAPYPDQILPVVALASFYFFWRAAKGGNLWWAAASGLVIFIGLQFTLAIAVILLTIGVAAALIILQARLSKDPQALSPGAWAARAAMGLAGFVVPALALKLFLDYDVLDVWRTCYVKHADFAQLFGRTYWKWALFSPVEMALFMGVPVACLAAWRIVRQARGAALMRTPADAAPPFDVVLWSFVLTVLVLDVSGKSLGEVGRLWMFLMPFGAMAAAEEVSRWRKHGAFMVILTALTGLQLFYFRVSLNVFGTLG